MAKKQIKNPRKLIVVVIGVILAFIIVFIGLPKIYDRESALITVIRVRDVIEPNTLITNDLLTTEQVGKYNLPGNVITKKENIIGLYSTVQILQTDNLVATKFQAEEERKDQFLYELKDNQMCVSVSIPSLASVLSGKVQEGDIVKVYVYKKKDTAAVDLYADTTEPQEKVDEDMILEYPELQYVQVVGITNNRTENIADVKNASDMQNTTSSNTLNIIPSTITFLCYPDQTKKLIEAENLGKIHIAFMARSEERAKEFLKFQKDILDKLYGATSEVIPLASEKVESIIIEEVTIPDTEVQTTEIDQQNNHENDSDSTSTNFNLE